VQPVFQIVDSDLKHILESQFGSETDGTRKVEPADGCPSHHPVTLYPTKFVIFLHKIIKELCFSSENSTSLAPIFDITKIEVKHPGLYQETA
jgi:hypothetical protein